jgi:hypothetical protein
MQEQEYADWIVRDTAEHLMQALAVYGIALGSYWIFVG